MMRSVLPLLSVIFALAACERATVNPPTEPANPVEASGAVPAAPAPPGLGPSMPGAGPATFVGRWAADANWCANTSGPEQPIRLTPTRFEGYENSCGIASLAQVRDGYEAGLACQAEGQASQERVRLSVQGDVLRLTWLDRNEAVLMLVRCPGAPVAGAPGLAG